MKFEVKTAMADQPSDGVMMREKGDNPGIGLSLVDHFEEVIEMVGHFIKFKSLHRIKEKKQK